MNNSEKIRQEIIELVNWIPEEGLEEALHEISEIIQHYEKIKLAEIRKNDKTYISFEYKDAKATITEKVTR